MRPYLFLSFLLLCSWTQGQNLVKNPGFEQYDRVPFFEYRYERYDSSFVDKHWYKRNRLYLVQDSADFALVCKDWYRAQESFPDYFRIDAKNKRYGIPDNTFGHYPALSDSAYAGFIPFSLEGGIELISGEFAEPLEEGKKYEISFFYCLAHTASYFYLDKIEAFISPDNWLKKICSFGPPLYYREVVTNDTYCQYCMDSTITDGTIPTGILTANVTFDTLLINDGKWHKITGHYQAKGDEKYISLGIFYQNEKFTKIMNKFRRYSSSSSNEQNRQNRLILDRLDRKYQSHLFIHRTPLYYSSKVSELEAAYYFIDDVSVREVPDVHKWR